jgi:hypothetical protein
MPSTQPKEAADFVTSAGDGLAGRIRGPGGWFGGDYELAVATARVPVLGHEVGQWCAYPDFDVIPKFTGYLRPGNYEIARDFAAAHGLLDRNKQLAHASGRFQLACYKEEIEANLRTPSLSGIQLLDLHDYLGQGTAPIGLLDAFWESKGYATPEEFRHFCNASVLLARVKDRIYTSSDTLTADAEVAHFGAAALPALVPCWRIDDAAGRTVAGGDLTRRAIPIGKNIALGRISADLSTLASPAAYKLFLGLRGTEFENNWNFWVYPATSNPSPPGDVLFTSAWPDAERQLLAGRKVLFQPSANDLDDDDRKLSTTPIFWNRLMNPRGTAFLGLWCDAKHPALSGFPTESNCDWQWIDVMQGARALNLDRLPPALQPIVQPIDDWNRSFKLGLIYECKVGNGRLLVCSADLASTKPSAQALRKSLLGYMTGEQFKPAVEISLSDLRNQWVSTRSNRHRESDATQPARSQAPEIDAAPENAVPRSNSR